MFFNLNETKIKEIIENKNYILINHIIKKKIWKQHWCIKVFLKIIYIIFVKIGNLVKVEEKPILSLWIHNNKNLWLECSS